MAGLGGLIGGVGGSSSSKVKEELMETAKEVMAAHQDKK
jgi:hypothetical protein